MAMISSPLSPRDLKRSTLPCHTPAGIEIDTLRASPGLSDISMVLRIPVIASNTEMETSTTESDVRDGFDRLDFLF
jgi:hypothetical protein